MPKAKTQTTIDASLVATLVQAVLAELNAKSNEASDTQETRKVLAELNAKGKGKGKSKGKSRTNGTVKGSSETSDAWESRKDAIELAKADASKRSLNAQVKIAVAEIRDNKAKGFVNAAIQKANPKSLRRYLTSEQNQALRACRISHDESYGTVETLLKQAFEK